MTTLNPSLLILKYDLINLRRLYEDSIKKPLTREQFDHINQVFDKKLSLLRRDLDLYSKNDNSKRKNDSKKIDIMRWIENLCYDNQHYSYYNKNYYKHFGDHLRGSF